MSDNSPFFHQLQKILPTEPLIVFDAGLVPITGLGVFYRMRCGVRSGPSGRRRLFFCAVFSLLGLGFILIEIRLEGDVGEEHRDLAPFVGILRGDITFMFLDNAVYNRKP